MCCLDSILKFWFCSPFFHLLKGLSFSTACFSQTVSRFRLLALVLKILPPLLSIWVTLERSPNYCFIHPAAQIYKFLQVPSWSSCPLISTSKSYQPNLPNAPQIHPLPSIPTATSFHNLPSPSWIGSRGFHSCSPLRPFSSCRKSKSLKYAHPFIPPPIQKPSVAPYCYKAMGQRGEDVSSTVWVSTNLMTLAKWLNFSALWFCNPYLSLGVAAKIKWVNK